MSPTVKNGKFNIEPVGAVVYWAGKDTDRKRLKAGLRSIGLEKFLPNKRTPDSALFNALKHTVRRSITHDSLIQPLKKRSTNGYEVVRVTKGEQKNEYSPQFSARVNGETVVFDKEPSNSDNVQEMYDHYRGLITGSALGACLVDICAHLMGTSLRPSGGIYWIPEDAVGTWDDVADAVSSAHPQGLGIDDMSCVYRLRTLLDANAANAVIDAITAEVDTQSEEIFDGIGQLGERALRTREKRSKELKQKVEHYELMLGQGLDKLKKVCDMAERGAAHAVLAQL